VSGCNLTLNPYLVIQMEHHHEHPLIWAMELRPDHWSATMKVSPRDPKELCTDTEKNMIIQSNNIHHAKIHLSCQPLKSLPFTFPGPTHHNPSMHIESSSSHFHATLTIPISFNSYANFHTKPIIYNSWIIPTYLMLQYIHISHHNIHTQPISIIQEPTSIQNSTLSRPAPRSGWRVSLKRDELAQVSPLRLGEGSRNGVETHAGSRLGETPLAWARCSLAQKSLWVAWATLRGKTSRRAPVNLA